MPTASAHSVNPTGQDSALLVTEVDLTIVSESTASLLIKPRRLDFSD